MLIDSYKIQNERTVNCKPLAEPEPNSFLFEYKGITLVTLDPTIFESYSPWYLREIFDIQLKKMEQELAIQTKYMMTSKNEAERTRRQYADLYFFEKDGKFYAFEKKLLMAQAMKIQEKARTSMSREVQKDLITENFTPKRTTDEGSTRNKRTSIIQNVELDDDGDIIAKKSKLSQIHAFVKDEELPDQNIDPDAFEAALDDSNDHRPSVAGSPIINYLPSGAIGVSVQAIRDITGYSWTVQMPWHTQPVEITWQKRFMMSSANVQVVDGSRQWGKSKSVAQKWLEETYVPGADLMVCAVLQETTESIWDYLLQYLEEFDPDEFEIKERKRYVQNNITGVRIHFRTLANGAKGIRGKTLRVIIADEAMLISNDVMESVILPTQTTIANPILILLGTASEDTSCYMYQTIMDIEKGNTYNGEWQFTAEYIPFSIDDNPLVSPKKRAYVETKKSQPNIQREYYNKWGRLEDSLFQPIPIAMSEARINADAWILLSIDPARKEDRSGWSIHHCSDGKDVVIKSWEVPIEWKGSWNMQAQYFLKLREQFKMFSNFIVVGDGTWVGDWVFEIFASMWLPVKFLCKYIAGDTVSEQSSDDEKVRTFTVGKSVLINNLIDLLGEGKMQIVWENNQLLLKEFERIQAFTTRTGKITFKTAFTDDVTNSVMVGGFFAKHMHYLTKTISIKKKETKAFDKELMLYSMKKIRWRWSTL